MPGACGVPAAYGVLAACGVPAASRAVRAGPRLSPSPVHTFGTVGVIIL